jgi:UDP-glucose 4-epimerase
MRVLVTGGAGFIGSHVVDALLAAGHEALVLDDLSRGRREWVQPRAALTVADIRDPGLEGILLDLRPEAVIHLAAQVDARRAALDPAADAAVNLMGGLNLLAAARAAGVARLVFTSTAAVYGQPQRLPVAEDDELRPLSGYGVSKLAFEQYLRLAARDGGPEAVVLRLANVYGPRQDPHGESGVVAIFAGQLLSGRPGEVFGDGRQARDFVHVDDCARACLLALEPAAAGGTFNVASGRALTVLDLHRRLGRLAGAELAPRLTAARAGEIQTICLDSGRIQTVLGWAPAIDLDEGLARTVDWFRGPTLR